MHAKFYAVLTVYFWSLLRAGVTGPGAGVGPVVPFELDGITQTNLPFTDCRVAGEQQFGLGNKHGVSVHCCVLVMELAPQKNHIKISLK